MVTLRKLVFFCIVFVANQLHSQMGDVWSIESKQEFNVDEDFTITEEYEEKIVCQFFMFVNNNEFIHVTDGITSLYKILTRDEENPLQPIYSVISEAENSYTYVFDQEKNEVIAYSTKGYAILFKCVDRHSTTVFENMNR